MKILFVITRADSIGGAHIHVRDLARRLVDSGHQVRVVTGKRGPFTAALEQAGATSVECPPLQRAIHPLRDAQAVVALRRAIAAFRPDLVSMHSSKAGILGRLACAIGGPPSLFTAHGWAFTPGVGEPRRSAYRWIERALAPLADRIVCVSEHDRRIAVAAGIGPRRLVTIHNGMPDVAATSRADPGGGDPVRVVMVARFAPQKDHPTLLRAFAAVEGAQLTLVGEGPTLASVRTLTRELGLEDRVRFLGHQDDVAEVLARSHLFALISRWEGFPRSTLEAMRAGLPVVVTDVGGSAEAVADGVEGYIVPPGDVETTRDRLVALVGDGGLRRRMGEAARRRFEAEFTFERMFARTLAVYGTIAAVADGDGSAPGPGAS